MATIRRRGNAWQLDLRAEGGGQKSLGPITEAEAEAILAAERERLTGAQALAGPLFADWAVTYAAHRARQYADSYYRVEQMLRTHLIPWFGSVPIAQIGPRQVHDYTAARLATGAKPATVLKECQTLRAALRFAVRLEVLQVNRAALADLPRDTTSRPPRWYTAEELTALYAAELAPLPSQSDEHRELHPRLRWTWGLMANTGLRRGEALHLRWRHVGRDEIRIVSEEGARTKSAKWRLVPVGEGAAEALEALRGDREWVVPQIRPESLSRAHVRTCERAGVQDGHIHCLRHTYAAHLVQRGVPLRTVQVLMGHASMKTTEQYAHLAPGHLRDAVRGVRL